MSRVNFVETITLPLGPGGSLIPVPGIAIVPFTINPDESEGPQAVAYAGRTGATQAATLVTDAAGKVNYWVESGDYDMVFTDTHNPPRIASYTQGFSAAESLLAQLITTGDTKFSFQAQDHGQNPDGSYEWILVTSDADGGGRKVLQTQYMALWYELGNPAVDGNGYFRLPNISGRQLVAAGAASGLTARIMSQMYGGESITLGVSNIPPHAHNTSGNINQNTGGQSNDHWHYVTLQSTTNFAQITATDPLAGYTGHEVFWLNGTPNPLSVNNIAGAASTIPGIGSLLWGAGGISHSHSDSGHSHITSGNTQYTSSDHTHNLNFNFSWNTDGGNLGAAGNGTGPAAAFSRLDPSFVVNLFVKS